VGVNLWRRFTVVFPQIDGAHECACIQSRCVSSPVA
jgi:hypothetical protein